MAYITVPQNSYIFKNVFQTMIKRILTCIKIIFGIPRNMSQEFTFVSIADTYIKYLDNKQHYQCCSYWFESLSENPYERLPN